MVAWVFGFLFVAAQFRGCETGKRLERIEGQQREIKAELELLRSKLDAQAPR